MQLFEGERLLLESDKKVLILTSHRVRLNSHTMGRTEIVSIMLDAISSCRLARVANPFLMWLGVGLVAIGGIGLAVDRSQLAVLLFVGVALLLIYSLSLKQVLEIASPSATIRVDARQMHRDQAKRFIDAVEEARNVRMFPGSGT